MFLLVLILVPVLEVLALVEVAQAIGWAPALAALILTSLLGVRVLRIQGRSAIERVSRAVSERREPGRAAVDGLLGFLGGALLAIPGFVTDAIGVLLLLPPSRRLLAVRLSRHYAGRAMRFATASARFAAGSRASRPADVESTAVEEDVDRLGR